MSGITNPAEVYFKDGIWAWASTVWEKLVSSGGRLFTALHGWDGSVWRKLPLVWGYSEGYCEQVDGAASGTGHAVATGSTATVGEEVFVVESINIHHDAGVDKRAFIRLDNNGCIHDIFNKIIETGVYSFWTGRLTIPPGGHIDGIVLTPGDGKKAFLEIWGYKMKIAE